MILIRSVLFNLFFYGVTFILTVAGTLMRPATPEAVLRVATLWARIVLWGARAICGIRLEVVGLDRLPPGPALIASAHQSAFDTAVWLTLVPRCCYVLKRELTRIPLLGRLITTSRMIAIDRSAGGAALRAMLRAGENAVRDGRQIVIFPEGTRTEPGLIGPLQPGVAALAARIRLPVIPVATDSGLCWGRRAFTKRPGTIRIVLGEPIDPMMQREALMRVLRDRIDIRNATASVVTPL